MKNNRAFYIQFLFIALVMSFQLNILAQTPDKTIESFYSQYLKNESKDLQVLKDFVSEELFQKTQQMEISEIQEYFTRKTKEMSLSDFVKFKQESNSSQYLIHLWTKDRYYAKLTLSLKEENGKWKIDKVIGKTFREIEEDLIDYTIETPELKNNLIKLEKPAYPSAAKAVRAFGEVKVEIIVDENGNVTSVKTVLGHPLLKESVENATLKSKFSPIIIDGKPCKFNGIITYIFKPW